jgi:tRNA/rRNA methyltransferase
MQGGHDMNSTLDAVRVVLVATSHPGNIGSAARAMKTMGLTRLVLVNPKRFPDPEATALASGAADVLEAATIVDSLDAALADTTLAFALTARRRDLSHPASDPREAAAVALEALRATLVPEQIAFVFGTEMSGLANDDVMRCQRLVHIPANPVYSSLNLSQAVQIIAYELWVAATGEAEFRNDRQADRTRPPRGELATHAEIEMFYAHLETAMIGSGFMDAHAPRRLMDRIRRIYGRARMEKEEVSLLRGMLTLFQSPHPPKASSDK